MKPTIRAGVSAVSLAVTLLVAACVDETPSAGPASTAGPVPTALVAPTPTPGAQEPAPTAVAVAAPTPSPSPTPPPTPEPAATRTVPTAAATTTPAPTPQPPPATPPAPTPSPVATANGLTPIADEAAIPAQRAELTTVEVVEVLRPSVVQISTQRAGVGTANQPIPAGVGTGIVLDLEGNILTNLHVIEGSQLVLVTLHTGESLEASPVGGDLRTDTAVIKIEADGLQPAVLGDSAALRVGEDVIAIGHALGLRGGPSVSKGVVSAVGRSIETDPVNSIFITDLVQTDASINPGNSGGPLVNARAEVVGVNTAIIEQSQGIGFALNINDVKVIVSQLLERGFVIRGFLGITPENVTPALAAQFNMPVQEGILVVRVIAESSAEAAGLEAGDIIVKLGGEPIINTGELSKFLLAHLPGETIDVEFVRLGVASRAEAVLGDRPR